ncbi:MAG: YHS domain-containing protein [Comamonadaceae bacterium]|nr:YHS domain-containing protein [Comamonadaceae bacterium]
MTYSSLSVTRRTVAPLLVSFTLALSGCGAMLAQNPSGSYKPVNAVADNPEARLMLKGADVTAYFTQGKYVQGDARYRSNYEGVDFRFASAQAKALFDKAPTQYLPQYGGYCANGVVYGIPWGGDADTWTLLNGKLYIFGGQGSKDAFLLDEKQNLALADKYWAEEVQGSNSFLQRSKRMIFRVPHYKSGEELAKMVAAGKSKP